MLTRRKVLFTAAGFFVLLGTSTGCSKPEPPKLVPKEVQVTALGPAGATLLLRFEATNPNGYEIAARSVTGRAKLDGKWELGTVTIAKPFALPPKVPTMLDVPLTLPWTDLKALTALGLATGPVPYIVDGTISIGGERLNVDLPFSLSGTVTREQVIGAALKGLPSIPGLTAPAQQ